MFSFSARSMLHSARGSRDRHLRCAGSNLSFKVSEHLVYLFKAGKGVGMAFEDLHHVADLSFVYDADEHILVGVGIHAVDVYGGYAVL